MRLIIFNKHDLSELAAHGGLWQLGLANIGFSIPYEANNGSVHVILT